MISESSVGAQWFAVRFTRGRDVDIDTFLKKTISINTLPNLKHQRVDFIHLNRWSRASKSLFDDNITNMKCIFSSVWTFKLPTVYIVIPLPPANSMYFHLQHTLTMVSAHCDYIINAFVIQLFIWFSYAMHNVIQNIGMRVITWVKISAEWWHPTVHILVHMYLYSVYGTSA